MLKRIGVKAKWFLITASLIGVVTLLPITSYIYAVLCSYKFTPWVWLAGLEHGLNPKFLLVSALMGFVGAASFPVFAAFLFLNKKPLHGDSHLARKAEIRKAGLYRLSKQSILLGKYKGKFLAFNGDLHPFLAAATGTGKGVGFVVPNLLNWQGSVIVLDIKGENFKLTSGYRSRVLGQKVYRFDPLNEEGKTHGFNVLSYVRSGDLRITDVQAVAAILAPNESTDPYWDSAARDLLTGLILLVLEAGDTLGWPKTLGQVYRVLQSEEETGSYLRALLESVTEKGAEISQICRRYILSFCNEPEKPRGSIKSALAAKLSLFSNPLLDRATGVNDIELGSLRREPTTIYLAVSPDELTRLSPVIRLFLEFFLTTNTRARETPADDAALSVPVLLLLDEFLSLGKITKLVHALSYVRGWGIKIATVIQSEAQLRAVYGHELAEFFIDNHRARVYYRPPAHRRDFAEALSKLIGQKTVKQTSYSYSSSGRRSRQVSETGQAILTADEITNLEDDDIIMVIEGVRPILGRKIRYFRDKFFKRKRLPSLPLPDPLEAADLSQLSVPESNQGQWIADPESLRGAIESLPVPSTGPTEDEINELAKSLFQIVKNTDRAALAELAQCGL